MCLWKQYFSDLSIILTLCLFTFPSIHVFDVCRCWMTNTDGALMAHYFINIPILVILVASGIVMLFLVYREIRTRDEWRKNCVAFLSIWGLSCLFGTTWGLTFLDFGPLSDGVLFLSCILNSFQGLWFYLIIQVKTLTWESVQIGPGFTFFTSLWARNIVLAPLRQHLNKQLSSKVHISQLKWNNWANTNQCYVSL